MVQGRGNPPPPMVYGRSNASLPETEGRVHQSPGAQQSAQRHREINIPSATLQGKDCERQGGRRKHRRWAEQ